MGDAISVGGRSLWSWMERSGAMRASSISDPCLMGGSAESQTEMISSVGRRDQRAGPTSRKGEGMEYFRRRWNERTWHWMANCPDAPLLEDKVTSIRPTRGLCKMCLALEKAQKLLDARR